MRLANTRSIAIFCAAFMLVIMGSCTIKQEELSGTYIVRGLRNNIDTLKLLRNGTYTRVLYAQRNQRLLFQNSDKWKRSSNDLILYNFLPDEDQEHNPEEVLGLGAMTCFFPTSKRFSTITIEFQAENDNMYYEKL
jgi:hypothetical protein